MMPTVPSLPTDPAAAQIEALERLGRRQAVPFGAGQVTWRTFGNGPPLVLLHGGHGSWLHWVRNVRPWAAHFTVCLPDLPGYGDSDVPAAPTLQALVEATCDTLDALVGAAATVRLAGFSFGGLVAAHLAARRGRVSHLALLGPAGHGGARRPRGELRPWRDAFVRQDMPALAALMRHNLATHMVHDPACIDALALRLHTLSCLRTRFHSRSISRAGGLREALAAHAGPLWLAWGEHDVTAVPAEAALSVAEGRRDCQCLIVPGVGHWVAFEGAEEVNARLLRWLLREAVGEGAEGEEGAEGAEGTQRTEGAEGAEGAEG